MVRSSTMLFLLSAVLFFTGSLFYLTQPVMPSLEAGSGLTSLELSFYNQYFNSLAAALESIIGANLLALSLLTVYVGFKAWQDNFAWIIGLLSLLCYALPLSVLAIRSEVIYLLILLPLIPYIFGLILALTFDRWEKRAGVNWFSKTITLK